MSHRAPSAACWVLSQWSEWREGHQLLQAWFPCVFRRDGGTGWSSTPLLTCSRGDLSICWPSTGCLSTSSVVRLHLNAFRVDLSAAFTDKGDPPLPFKAFVRTYSQTRDQYSRLIFLKYAYILFKSQTARGAVLENGVHICSLHINNQRPRESILFILLM